MGKKRRAKRSKKTGHGKPQSLPPVTDYLPVKFPGRENSGPPEKPSDEDSPVEDDNQEKAPALKDGGNTDRTRKTVAEVVSQQLSSLEAEKARRRLLREAWQERDSLYRELFGEHHHVAPANYGPPTTEVPEDFEERARKRMAFEGTANPGDPTLEEEHLAVLSYGPDPMRPFWLHITAGLASPWLQTEWQEVSGYGMELAIKTPTNAPWAAQLLRTLGFYVLQHAGQLSPGVRVNLNSPVVPDSQSLINNAFIWYLDEAPDGWYKLPSGGFGIFAAVGITEAERQFAETVEEYGTWCVQQVLNHLGYGQITDPDRACITAADDIDSILFKIKMAADSFRQSGGGPGQPGKSN